MSTSHDQWESLSIMEMKLSVTTGCQVLWYCWCGVWRSRVLCCVGSGVSSWVAGVATVLCSWHWHHCVMIISVCWEHILVSGARVMWYWDIDTDQDTTLLSSMPSLSLARAGSSIAACPHPRVLTLLGEDGCQTLLWAQHWLRYTWHRVSSWPSLMQTSVQIGRAAKDIQTTLESSLHNVAENIEGAFGTAERG